MALEIELKYLKTDHNQVRAIIAKNSGKKLGRHYERNVVLDDPSRTLYKRSALLRIRQASDKIIMTVKRIPAMSADKYAKTYIEHETEVSNFDETLSALSVLGYYPVFKYEKIREEWQFENCIICLDTLPFGDFIEIEGSEKHILSCAKKLKLKEQNSSKKTYHELNREHQLKNGLPLNENFVFSPEEVKAIL